MFATNKVLEIVELCPAIFQSCSIKYLNIVNSSYSHSFVFGEGEKKQHLCHLKLELLGLKEYFSASLTSSCLHMALLGAET